MLNFEYKSQPLISRQKWLVRVLKCGQLALYIVLVSLAIGLLGYHFIGGLGWVDAFLESAMILGGMGAIAPMDSDGIKIFAGFYALYSGFVVISVSAILVAPFLHRLLHKFHVKDI